VNVIPTALPGVLILEPRVFRDGRGWFVETWQAERYAALGLPSTFVQDNVSRSGRDVLRGLHVQNPRPQGKLVTVLEGTVWDVAVDVRRGSPTFGQWAAVELSGETLRQFWVPAGFAHGFLVRTESAVFSYKCTDGYAAAAEFGVRWDDPDLAIPWPSSSPIVSDKDAALPFLRDIAPDRLVAFHG